MPKPITLSDEHINFLLSKSGREVYLAMQGNGYIYKGDRKGLTALLCGIAAQLHGISEAEVHKLFKEKK
jgi:hypothetical protein